jgi:hypothetical protein
VLATFFSDVGHEMATPVLPLYLVSIRLGPAVLGATERLADLVFSLSKLAGGVVAVVPLPEIQAGEPTPISRSVSTLTAPWQHSASFPFTATAGTRFTPYSLAFA